MACTVSHNDVVKQRDAEHFAGVSDTARELAIGVARRWVTARMVVAEDDRHRSKDDRSTKHLAWMHDALVEAATANLRKTRHTVLRVEEEYKHHLLIFVTEQRLGQPSDLHRTHADAAVRRNRFARDPKGNPLDALRQFVAA